MKKNPVVFIAKREYDNLGIGYMSAVLNEAGFATKTIDFCEGKKKILKILKRVNPLLVGFSVIYQYHIDQFASLVSFLREGGVKCHFTAGGHYASLKYEELFRLIPSLDSVVRFEGEYTISDLAKCISSGKEWRETESIAYLDKGEVIANKLRPLEKDLDTLPYPVRSPLADYAFGKKFATILAGRGCVYDCSFCNLKEFYLPFRGAVKRMRKPEKIAEEMEYLFREKDCSVFLFQDDDFPVKKSSWIEKFCNEIDKRGLSEKIMWKINCRPDEIDEKSFARMKSTGLFLVFVGIEDGTDAGLERLNKKMTVSECIAGINILKKLAIGFDFGFLPFQPSTTFVSLNENLNFLVSICGDGYSPVTFLKMMPYYNTQVERELIDAGRIKGKPGYRDYDFIEDALNAYFDFISECFMKWTRYPDGVTNISKWARNYISVCVRFYKLKGALPLISKDVNKLISESNLFFLDSMRELAAIFETGVYKTDNSVDLKSYRKKIKRKHKHYRKQINNSMINLLTLVELQRREKSFKIPGNPGLTL
jgi:anaerobic magnesium-protoporphyrin IX monomethyl ester cyclase